MEEILVKKFKSSNGIIFDKKEDCEKYENILSNIQYYMISYCPDSNENGVFQKHNLYMINANKKIKYEIALSIALKLCDGKVIHHGYSDIYFPEFKICELSKDEFENLRHEKYVNPNVIFVSNEEVFGFPSVFCHISDLL